MERVHNFNPGPAALPREVLEQAQRELLSYDRSGMSVMEISHRSAAFEAIIGEARDSLKELMNIPDNYRILFVQGGASTQFAAVPLNLFSKNGKADYVVSGNFAQKAKEQAERYGLVNVAASSKDKNFSYIPALDRAKFTPDADFFHITLNNTVYGTRFTSLPETGDIPIVADASSCILSEACDVSRFGLIYAGAQKNIGPSGVTIVIVREDLVGHALACAPVMLDYKTYVESDSLYNTPPTFAIYMSLLVFRRLKALGGVSAIQKINEEKAAYLYNFIDNSKIFTGTAERKDRSIMNVTFVLPSKELDAKFVREATAAGLVGLKGHKAAGGMRASIYNAVEFESVKALVEFMKKFELENGGAL
ncbi:MAG: 3-phosphoserine/phosphohydroxythreonine transaminase [Oscillospiraceae bacterium]|nr:3-phosphoserine/phosphohydroxythreonine transaminase [Oscillospiraceae bacterium]